MRRNSHHSDVIFICWCWSGCFVLPGSSSGRAHPQLPNWEIQSCPPKPRRKEFPYFLPVIRGWRQGSSLLAWAGAQPPEVRISHPGRWELVPLSVSYISNCKDCKCSFPCTLSKGTQVEGIITIKMEDGCKLRLFTKLGHFMAVAIQAQSFKLPESLSISLQIWSNKPLSGLAEVK